MIIRKLSEKITCANDSSDIKMRSFVVVVLMTELSDLMAEKCVLRFLGSQAEGKEKLLQVTRYSWFSPSSIQVIDSFTWSEENLTVVFLKGNIFAQETKNYAES